MKINKQQNWNRNNLKLNKKRIKIEQKHKRACK